MKYIGFFECSLCGKCGKDMSDFYYEWGSGLWIHQDDEKCFP